MPDIFLEIDKHIINPGISDIPSNNLSPMPYRRPNSQGKPEIYLNSLPRTPQQQQQQQPYYMTSTPPALRSPNSNQIKPNNNFLNDQIDTQYYSSNTQDLKFNESK